MEIKALVADSSKQELKNITRSLKEIGVRNCRSERLQASPGALEEGQIRFRLHRIQHQRRNEEMVKTSASWTPICRSS